MEFKEANQVRLELKMKLSVYAWYCSSVVVSDKDGYSVVIVVKKVSDSIRKVVPQILNGVEIKLEEQNRKIKRPVKKVMDIE